MKTLKTIFMCAAAAVALLSCTKDIDKVLPSNECSILEIELEGQLGRADIVRVNGTSGTVAIFVMDNPDFPWSAVKINALALSSGASSNAGEGDTLDFYNPERSARITVTSQTGKQVVWTISIKPYEAFYVGKWNIEDVKIYLDQNISGSGTGSWDTSMGGEEFGLFAGAELDNVITITMNEGMTDGRFTGKIVNDAGPDGEYGNFWGVWPGEYSEDEPLDMNPRLRHLLPAGESDWSLNLSTNEMSITQRNITSTMTFRNDGTLWFFDFALPSAAGDPAGTNFYNNFWRSSWRFSYIVKRAQ